MDRQAFRPRFGAAVQADGVRFSAWSGTAERVWVSIFSDDGQREIERLELHRTADGTFSGHLRGGASGLRYGFRADGPFDPARGLWFDPDKLLMDPYAVAIDRPYVYHPELAARRGEGADTAPLMPKAVVTDGASVDSRSAALFDVRGAIYELPVRAFTKLHPDVPPKQRGTISALGHPAVIHHLRKLNISCVELMPITAWIDERHLPPLGLAHAWGYNPVSFMALDPRVAPGGIRELRDAVAALHEAGIGVILDLVFNHTGESDEHGPTLSLRGLDNLAYYRHRPGDPGKLVNDTGTGNTVACQHPIVRELVLDCLQHFVLNAGVDGFRFDLATVLGRDGEGFDPAAPLLAEIATHPVLADRVLVAEPWDIGPDGYQLGRFGERFLEWNDRYRDDVRRFWRGDPHMLGHLATRLAGSSDIFGQDTGVTRTVNFIAAHDGMTLADLTRYEQKHNEANGEANRDGHGENFSWNCGMEGESSDPELRRARERDVRALLATLFASRGAIMLTAGDEFGRSQRGNNNAYAQDNALTWLDWTKRDRVTEDFVASLSALRRRFPDIAAPRLLAGAPSAEGAPPDVEWLGEDAQPLQDGQWHDGQRRGMAMVIGTSASDSRRLMIAFNAERHPKAFRLPTAADEWEILCASDQAEIADGAIQVGPRSVVFVSQRRAAA